MAKLEIKYRLEGKALPPRPIKVAIGGWGGSAALKKENGSQPEPWHCPLFVDGCTQGVELLYQYETECHIVNDGGKVRIEWDREREPGGGTSPNDFTLSAPPPSTDYLFATSMDIQAPPGYVLRTETHPRFFRDHTRTVPAAFYGHVQSEWWPKILFIVFRVPAPGQRHIFRKGEPYAQLLFIPRDDYVLTPMTEDEKVGRRKLEEDIKLCKSLIAKRIWNSASSMEFNDHYTVLGRAYEQGGLAAVEAMVRDGIAMYRAVVPEGKSTPEYIELVKIAYQEGRYVQAKEILHHVIKTDPRNAEAHTWMAAISWEQKVPAGALAAMRRAISLRPDVPEYRMSLAEMCRQVGRLDDAQREIQAALNLEPNNPKVLTALGFTIAQRGFVAEGVERCRTAALIDPKAPDPPYVIGLILAQAGQQEHARSAFQAALALDPNFAPALQALTRLSNRS
jgi:Tfp pilus assembly protein PilF